MHPLIAPDFNQIWIFSTDFRQILKYQISCNSVRWELSCVMRTDGQTERQRDMTKLIGPCSKVCESAEIQTFTKHSMRMLSMSIQHFCHTLFFSAVEIIHTQFYSYAFKCHSYLIQWRSGFGGLEVACWPLVPKSAGSNPAEASARLPSERK